MHFIDIENEMRIFGIIYPLYTMSNFNPGKIEADLNELQKIMRCEVETASDIVSILK